jgi:GTP-binding protein HflX
LHAQRQQHGRQQPGQSAGQPRQSNAPYGGAAAVARRADVIVVDHALSPIQMRNLASATGADVLDRTGVIVEIFHRHASSREARLQVEMARLKYVAPRLRFAGQGGFDRQGGGILLVLAVFVVVTAYYRYRLG